jgi:hypothetical protein
MTQRNTDDRLSRRMAAVKALNTEADDLFVALAELEGGDAEIEGTIERCEVFRWVSQLPKYNAAARNRLFEVTR